MVPVEAHLSTIPSKRGSSASKNLVRGILGLWSLQKLTYQDVVDNPLPDDVWVRDPEARSEKL